MPLGLSTPWVTAAVSALSARVPDRLVTAALAATYPRFEPELARLGDFCPTSGTALDIGAWYGPWSRALARRLDRVVAVEPNPAVARVLARTAPPNVDVVRAAITDTPGAGVLYVPDTGRGTEATASMASAVGPAVPVTTTTIDHLAPPDVSIIKLDVEGMETTALRGAATVLTEHSPVLLIELEYRHGPVDEIVEHLAGFGYRAEILAGGAWRPLAGFDLAAHQERMLPLVTSRGYLEKVLRGGPHYINNVLFRKAQLRR
ncbi:FkbM family methyltransferase [Actinokineospora sp. 24-640]